MSCFTHTLIKTEIQSLKVSCYLKAAEIVMIKKPSLLSS